MSTKNNDNFDVGQNSLGAVLISSSHTNLFIGNTANALLLLSIFETINQSFVTCVNKYN